MASAGQESAPIAAGPTGPTDHLLPPLGFPGTTATYMALLGCDVNEEHTAALPGYTVGKVIGEGGFCQASGWGSCAVAGPADVHLGGRVPGVRARGRRQATPSARCWYQAAGSVWLLSHWPWVAAQTRAGPRGPAPPEQEEGGCQGD